MPTKKTIKLSHDNLKKIIEKQANEAREQALEEKRRALKKDPKKAQQQYRKPLIVLKKTYEVEKQITKDKRRKGVTMLNIIKEVYELTKEFATLKSPVEVYIFVGMIWASGVCVGLLL